MSKKYIEGTKFEDLTGNRYNKLTVNKFLYIKQTGYNKKEKKIIRQAFYLCRCDCGNDKIVNGNNLKSGSIKSCGCLVKSRCKLRRKSNKYKLFKEENYGIGYAYNDNEEFYFDLEDYDKIKQHYWWHEPSGYFSSPTRYDSSKKIRLHRLIMGLQPNNGLVVDHINPKAKYDNRKNNLRICTDRENSYNMPLKVSNKSGFTGVYWSKKDKSWYSQITYNGKCIHLGYTKTKEEAIKQRLEAELKYFGKDFAPQRHLFKEYQVEITD